MACSSFAFFLFSYQVHEKSILLPLLPVTLLAPEVPRAAAWLVPVATFSMFPLLKRDGLQAAYAACLLLWAALASFSWQAVCEQSVFCTTHSVTLPCGKSVDETSHSNLKGTPAESDSRISNILSCIGPVALVLQVASLVIACLVHFVAATTIPPPRLPFLHDAAFTCSSFLFVTIIAVAMNIVTYFPRFRHVWEV